MPISDFFISCQCPGGLPNEKVLLNPPNKILYFWRMFHPAYVYFCPYLRRRWGPFFPKIFFTTWLNLLKCNHPDKTLRFLQWLLHCDKVLIVAVVADAYLGFWSSDTIKRLGKLMVYRSFGQCEPSVPKQHNVSADGFHNSTPFLAPFS